MDYQQYPNVIDSQIEEDHKKGSRVAIYEVQLGKEWLQGVKGHKKERLG